MSTQRPCYRFVARLSLALAALLFVAGAAAGPAAHAALAEREAGQEGGQPEPPQHDGQHCALCHAPGHATPPAGAAGPVGATLEWSPGFPDPADAPRARSHAPTRARAPPLI